MLVGVFVCAAEGLLVSWRGASCSADALPAEKLEMWRGGSKKE